MDISALSQQISKASDADSAPPVDKWNPDYCGELNLVIKRSGQWLYEGTPFTRPALIKLFASVIKKEDEKYFLVTPVEKLGISVEDVPFTVIDHKREGDALILSTNCGDTFAISDKHPVVLKHFDVQANAEGNKAGNEENLVPYCLVRRNLWARVHQNVLYRWAEQAQPMHIDGKKALGLESGDYRFPIGLL